jgi:hypothetical protein
MSDPLTVEQRALEVAFMNRRADAGMASELDRETLRMIAANHARMVPWEVVERAMEYFCAKEYVYKHHQTEAKAMLEKWRPT